MYERAIIAAEGFQNLSWMCVLGFHDFSCKEEPTRNPSQHTQTLPIKLLTIWPRAGQEGPLDVMNGNGAV